MLPDELLRRSASRDRRAVKRLSGQARAPLLRRTTEAAATLEATALMEVTSQLPLVARPFVIRVPLSSIWREVGASRFRHNPDRGQKVDKRRIESLLDITCGASYYSIACTVTCMFFMTTGPDPHATVTALTRGKHPWIRG